MSAEPTPRQVLEAEMALNRALRHVATAVAANVEALEECHRLAGEQFDPDVVEALETVLALGRPARYPSRWGPSGS